MVVNSFPEVKRRNPSSSSPSGRGRHHATYHAM
nr:MAG TPA: hypothetical protein [Caudoviricetes sp.]